MIDIGIEVEIEAAVKKSLLAINKRYLNNGIDPVDPVDLSNYIEKEQSDLLSDIHTVEDKINSQWIKCIEENKGLNNFKLALSQWYRLRITEIEAYLKFKGISKIEAT